MSNKKSLMVIVCSLAVVCCASFTPVEKVIEDNKIVKVILNDKSGVTGWYIINYDTSHRITSIHKYTPKKNTPVTRIQLQYRGKLLGSYVISSTSPESDIILHQSTHILNYTPGNDLRRVDISFNKPASIKQAGTTFVRIQYLYTDKVLSGLTINGDAFSFKITCSFGYHKDAIESITIDEKRYNITTKKFEQGLKGILYIDNTPKYFVDEITKKTIKDKQELSAIYTKTFIADALNKLMLRKGNDQIIDYFLLSDSSL